MSKQRLLFLVFFLFFFSVVGFPQDTSQNIENESPQNLSSMSSDDLWISALTLLDGILNSSETTGSELTNLLELEMTESNILLILNELGMNEEQVLNYLITKMNLNEEESESFRQYWQNLKDGMTPEPDKKVSRGWRAAALWEALLTAVLFLIIIL